MLSTSPQAPTSESILDSCLNRVLVLRRLPNGDFLILPFFLNLSIGNPAIWKSFLLSHLLTHLCVDSAWTHGFPSYLIGYGLLRWLFILMLKWSQVWPAGAPSHWLLCPFHVPPPPHSLDTSLLSGTGYCRLILYSCPFSLCKRTVNLLSCRGAFANCVALTRGP